MFRKLALFYFISLALPAVCSPLKAPSRDQIAETSCVSLMKALARWGTSRITPAQQKAFQTDIAHTDTTIHRPSRSDLDKAIAKLNVPDLQYVEFHGRQRIKNFLFEWSNGYCEAASKTWDAPKRKLTQMQEVQLVELASTEKPLIATLIVATDLAIAGCALAAVTGFLDWKLGLGLVGSGSVALYALHKTLVSGVNLPGSSVNNRVRFHANPASDLMIDFPMDHSDLFFARNIFASLILDEPEPYQPRLRIVYLSPESLP